MTNEQKQMTNEQKHIFDQAVCHAVHAHQMKRESNTDTCPDRDLIVGDVLQTDAGELAVEQKHLDAVHFFHVNSGTRSTAGITFRIEG